MTNLKLLFEKNKAVYLYLLFLTVIFLFGGCRCVGRMTMNGEPEACQAYNIPLNEENTSSQVLINGRDSLQSYTNIRTMVSVHAEKQFTSHPCIRKIKDRFGLIQKEGKEKEEKGVIRTEHLRIKEPGHTFIFIGAAVILIGLMMAFPMDIIFILFLFPFTKTYISADIVDFALVGGLSGSAIIIGLGLILMLTGMAIRLISTGTLKKQSEKRPTTKLKALGIKLLMIGAIAVGFTVTVGFLIAFALTLTGGEIYVTMATAVFLAACTTISLAALLLFIDLMKKR